MSSYQREREALGQRLRELRRNADLTGRQLAESCGWNQSKVSRIEAGKTTPSDGDLSVWAKVCEAPEQTTSLVAALRSFESHYLEYRRLFRAGLSDRQQSYRQLEAEADHVRNFEAMCIPGLLQVPDYARHLLARATRFAGTSPNLDEAVAARIHRQQILYSGQTKFHFVVTEAALRFRLCPIDVLAAQLDRLLGLTSLPTVGFGVIPFDVEYSVATPSHGFLAHDDRLVRVENFSAVVEITDRDEVDVYLGVFADLASKAAYGARARAIITRVLAEISMVT